MPDKMLLHPHTKKRLEAFESEPAAAILITGQTGSGKADVGRRLAAGVLGLESSQLQNYPYFSLVRRPKDKQEIPIEAIRQIIKEMRLKPVINSRGAVKRVIMIVDAGRMSEEAQNALLKTLEEPTAETLFILTAESETQVLPTIASRTQKLAVAPVGLDESLNHFSGHYPAGSISSAWQLSQGAVGLLSALLSDDSQHPLKMAVDEAKQFLRKDLYGRTLYLDSLSSDKTRLLEFLNGLSRVLAALHHSVIKSENQRPIKRLSLARRQVNSAISSLNRNTSPRLVGLHLALNLPI